MADENTEYCNKTPYKDLYDEFTTYSFFGGLLEYFYEPMDSAKRGERLNTGYIVNKEFSEIGKWTHPVERRLHFRVFDHLRVIEESMTGIYTTFNQEFKHIMRPFMREYMFGHVYVIYSKEFREYELALAKKLAKEANQDPVDRVQSAKPYSNFRLLKRVVDDNGNESWDAILSQVKNVNVDQFLPKDSYGEPIYPPKLSFDGGYMFVRLFEIFRRYEAQMQTYYRAFQVTHTMLELDVENPEHYRNKSSQFASANVMAYNVLDSDEGLATVKDLGLFDKMSNLTESYHIIQHNLNDTLGRLGLAVDDVTKKERLTVGENSRALQPLLNFQMSVLHDLEDVSRALKIVYGVDVKFINTVERREQRMANLNISPFNKYDEKPTDGYGG